MDNKFGGFLLMSKNKLRAIASAAVFSDSTRFDDRYSWYKQLSQKAINKLFIKNFIYFTVTLASIQFQQLNTDLALAFAFNIKFLIRWLQILLHELYENFQSYSMPGLQD